MSNIQTILVTTSMLCSNIMLIYLVFNTACTRYRTNNSPKCVEAYPTYIRYPYPPNRDIVTSVSDV